jgi:small-conductance mechanosensitive channel
MTQGGALARAGRSPHLGEVLQAIVRADGGLGLRLLGDQGFPVRQAPTIWLLFFAGVVVVPPVVAQETPLPQEPAGAAVAERPVTIEPADVPVRADRVAAEDRRIDVLLRGDADVAAIEDALPRREARITELLGELDRLDASQATARRLVVERNLWLEMERQLDAWAVATQARYADLEEEWERARAERILWELTLDRAQQDELPPELMGRLDLTITRLRELEEELREARNRASFLAERVSTSQDHVAESRERLAVLEQRMSERRFDRSGAPLWELERLEEGEILRRVGEARREWWRSLFAFAAHRRSALISLALLFVALIPAATQLRRVVRARTQSGDPSVWERLASRPFSLAVTLILPVAGVFGTTPPGAAGDVLLLVTLVPVVRVGAIVLPAGTMVALYGAAGLTVLARIASQDQLVPGRGLLLAVTLLALLGMARMAPRTRDFARERGGLARLATVLAYTGMALLVVALLANLLGWVELSRLLTAATVERVYGAFVWAIVWLSLVAFLPAVLTDATWGFLRRRSGTQHQLEGLLGFVVAIMWTRGTLTAFHVWPPLHELWATIAGTSLSVGGMTIYTGGIVGAIVVLIVTHVTARLVASLAREELLPRMRVRPGAAESVVTLGTYVVYGIGAVVAASALGLGATQLTVVIGALGVGIGFGLKNIVDNFVSGLLLIVERPIGVGDTVQTTNHLGRVVRIGIRSSTIRSYDGAEIILPNADLVAHEVINWTRSDQTRRIEAFVGVAYGTEPERVLEVLRTVAAGHPKVLDDPGPAAHMIGFGESSLDFRLRCWVMMADFVDVLSDLYVGIEAALDDASIRIPFPQRDLHLKPTEGAVDGSLAGHVADVEASSLPKGTTHYP